MIYLPSQPPTCHLAERCQSLCDASWRSPLLARQNFSKRDSDDPSHQPNPLVSRHRLRQRIRGALFSRLSPPRRPASPPEKLGTRRQRVADIPPSSTCFPPASRGGCRAAIPQATMEDTTNFGTPENGASPADNPILAQPPLQDDANTGDSEGSYPPKLSPMLGPRATKVRAANNSTINRRSNGGEHGR